MLRISFLCQEDKSCLLFIMVLLSPGDTFLFAIENGIVFPEESSYLLMKMLLHVMKTCSCLLLKSMLLCAKDMLLFAVERIVAFFP